VDTFSREIIVAQQLLLRNQRCQLEEENAQLRLDKARLESRVAQLQAENARLINPLAAARKHSGNSSKAPSSDIVKPHGQRPKKKSKRRIGGQKGHPQRHRPAFAPDQVDQRIPLRLKQRPVDPSRRISPAEASEHRRTIQQVELVKKPFRVVEYTAYSIGVRTAAAITRPLCPGPSSRPDCSVPT
jgi:hypothetical protein